VAARRAVIILSGGKIWIGNWHITPLAASRRGEAATPYRTFDNPIDLAADSGQLAIRHA